MQGGGAYCDGLPPAQLVYTRKSKRRPYSSLYSDDGFWNLTAAVECVPSDTSSSYPRTSMASSSTGSGSVMTTAVRGECVLDLVAA